MIASRNQRAGRRTIALAAAVLLAAPLAFAAERQRFGETLEVVTVEVPVQVVARGAPVRGLGVESFELFAGGKRQTITGFEVIDLEAASAQGRGAEAVPLPARRHFLLLFDLSFSQPEGVVKAREASRRVIDHGLQASDLVAVGSYSLHRGARLLLGFTPDRDQLRTALDHLGVEQYPERHADPLGLVANIDPVLRSSADPSLGGAGRLGGVDLEALARQHFADLSVATARVTREQQIDRARAFTSSFEELASMLRTVRGRKQVVLFSEGFDSTAILGTDSAERATVIARAAERGEYWRIDSDERFGSSATLGFLDSMLEAFRRADAVIHAVDVGGARTAARAQGAVAPGGQITDGVTEGLVSRSENTLFVIAEETGGELYRNFNDLEAAMSQLLARTAVTYVLSFSPKKPATHGSFQRLQVKLKGVAPGTRAVARPGFYAPTAYRDRSALERQLEAADLVLDSSDGGAIESHTWATATTARARGSEVLVFADFDGPSLLRQQEHDIARFRLFAYAIDAKGGIGDFITQALTLDLDRVERSIRDGGLVFFASLGLAPGDYRVRTVIQDAYSGRFSARTTRVHVAPANSGAMTLAPPLFALRSGQGLLLIEDDRRERAAEYPLKEQQLAFVPRARALAGRAEPMPVMVAAYDAACASFEAWLENPQGQRLENAVEIIQPLAAAEDGSWRAQLMLDTRALVGGTYTLEIRLHRDGKSVASHGRLMVGGR